jgi:hypothetical protein
VTEEVVADGDVDVTVLVVAPLLVVVAALLDPEGVALIKILFIPSFRLSVPPTAPPTAPAMTSTSASVKKNTVLVIPRIFRGGFSGE